MGQTTLRGCGEEPKGDGTHGSWFLNEGNKGNAGESIRRIMTKKIKKLSVYISLGVIPFGVATVGLVSKASHAKHVSTVDAAQETDGAFRDGFYLGGLDAEDAREVRPSVGRWSDPKDRALFLAGYQRGYEEARAKRIAEQRH
jgi:hypothetical protein